MPSRIRTGAPRRSGLVILIVLVVVTVSATIASSVLLRVDASAVESRAALRSAQSRAAVWSGVQAVMARLAEQREDLLAGQAPILPESWTFPVESPDGRIVFRVVPASDGLPAESENARLDINLATPEMLAALPGISESLSSRLVSDRPPAGYDSVEELTTVAGISLDALIGAPSGAEPDGFTDLALSDEMAPPLVSLLTVWSFDPNVQSGSSGALGARRTLLPAAWTQELDRELERRIGRDAADALRAIAGSETAPKSTGGLADALRRSSVQPETWGVILDTFAVSDATHSRGLVDLNRAPASVLGAIPGLDEESARAIVDARERLTLDSRGTIAWILEQDLVTPEAFVEAADWLTTRSTQWRVVVEGGFELMALGDPIAENDTGAIDGLDLGGSLVDTGKRDLLDRVVLEAVVDVSTRRPRLAALREITGREYVRALAVARELEPESGLDEVLTANEPESPVGPIEESSLLPDPPPLVAPRVRDRSPQASHEPEAQATTDNAAVTGRSGRWGGRP